MCKSEGHNAQRCPNARRVDTAPAPAPPQPVHAVARAESHDSARAHTLSMSNETEDTAQNQPSDRTLSAVAGMLSLRECDGLPVADNETFEPPAENNTAGHNEQPRHDVPAVIEEQPHPDGSDVNALIIRDGDEEDFMDIDDGNIGEGIIGTDTEVESDEEPTDEAPTSTSPKILTLTATPTRVPINMLHRGGAKSAWKNTRNSARLTATAVVKHQICWILV